MTKKRTLVMLLIALVALFVGLFWSRRGQKPVSQQPPAPTSQFVEQPALPSPVYTTQSNYLVNVTEAPQKTLPIYVVVSKPAIKSVASSFAASLNLPEQPKEISSTRGTIYLWSGNNQSVVANEGLLNIAYAGTGKIGGLLNKPIETYYSRAEQLVAPLRLSSSPIRLIPKNPRYFNPNAGGANEVNSSSQATSVQLNYQYVLNDVPIYTQTTTNPGLTVRLSSDGDVLSFSATVLPTIAPSTADASVISYNEAAARLAKGEGRLVDLVSADPGDQPYYFDSPPTITDVNNVELVYYYATGQSAIVPVYAFRGTGKVNNKTVNTTTLVSAIK
jgi:hypothetical protein